MASLSFLDNFDAREVPESNFEPIPAGSYKAMAAKSEMKTSQAGAQYLSMQFKILDGEHKGRLIFNNFNLRHSKPDVAQMAKAEFASLCRACSVFNPRDTAELHNKPIMLKVGLQKRKDTGELQNTVKGYSPLGSASSAQSAPVESSSEPAPWE
uniref:DUF669 domain-containing protein n=2 Tax=Rubinisphaera brasiliensis TaxID=119 RepID=F0SNJ4_RUBBR|nr:protein of unknown function DUF669 [Rubinisphaera brasiliensis DSM 5305]